MSDDALIEAVAILWVSNGGDREGFCYLVEKIKEAIDKEASHE